MCKERKFTVVAKRLDLQPYRTDQERPHPDLVYWMNEAPDTGRVDFAAFNGAEISRVGLWINEGDRSNLANFAIQVADWCNANDFMQVQVMVTLEPRGRSFLQVVFPDQYEDNVPEFTSHWDGREISL